MDWAPHVIGTSIRKVLDLDPSNDSYVHLRYVPPEPAPLGRRLHMSINETFYFVSGDFPSWEYTSPDDTDGQLIIFRGGTFMDREPFSIHGTRPKLLPMILEIGIIVKHFVCPNLLNVLQRGSNPGPSSLTLKSA